MIFKYEYIKSIRLKLKDYSITHWHGVGFYLGSEAANQHNMFRLSVVPVNPANGRPPQFKPSIWNVSDNIVIIKRMTDCNK